MSRFQASFPIGTERYSTGGLRYDVTIYQRGNSFHAAWFCKLCLSRTESGECSNPAQAKSVAEADIEQHQLHGHYRREAGG